MITQMIVHADFAKIAVLLEQLKDQLLAARVNVQLLALWVNFKMISLVIVHVDSARINVLKDQFKDQPLAAHVNVQLLAL